MLGFLEIASLPETGNVWTIGSESWRRLLMILEFVYRSSFQLLESNNLNNKSLLEALRTLYIFALAKVNVVK
jgi:hypothetical protein